MSTRTSSRVAVALILTVAGFSIAGLAGCMTPAERSENAAASAATSFRTDLNRAPENIQMTIDRLNKTVGAQNSGRAGDFEVFGRNLASLREQGRRLGSRADSAEAAANTFFREWAREANRDTASGAPMLDETLASRGDNSQAALRLLRDGRASFSRMIGSLTAVETSLTGNLTDANVATVQPTVSAAIREANETKLYIAALTNKIDAALAKR
jgi:hypothetical protein